jgi:K+-transporting ATPase ATPase A chain
MAALVAIVRTLFARREEVQKDAAGRVIVGNFYQDLVRAIVRVMLPLAFVTALLLAWQGVPSTFQGAQPVQPLDQTTGIGMQHTPVGPVAAMVAIKQLGSNGGGWYGPNSSMPLENPTPLANLLECTWIILLPLAQIFMLGYLCRRRPLAFSILAVMLVLSITLSGLAIWSENQPNAAFTGLAAEGANYEGKEIRFGPTASALWGALTTQTSNGSVNAMHDSFNPGAAVATLLGMFINSAFGGVGVGLINYLLFIMLAVFLGSLMIGRAPELLGRPLETREMKLIALTLLLQPLLVLGFTAASFVWPGLAQTSNPGFHGISQVLYEYTSAFANNGSGFEGLGDNTVWWNLSCTVNLIIGRFIPILAPLAIAAWLAGKRTAPLTSGSLAIETPTFAVLTLGVIVMFTLLSFLPVLVLGPVGEALMIAG